ncbi:YdcF family protein [Demequina silvatica]|uniref:YdcF family protein n=1 Tax=Demequina silvatica TaxID=1638988 RepID=UPI00146FEC37|nr:YdcF family protein [Demequina silvatica]
MGRLGKVLLALVAAGIAFVLVGLPLYVYPAHDEPREVDAVYVLGSPMDMRMDLAEQMVADGLTDTVVVSISEDPAERQWVPQAVEACETSQEYTIICGTPDPFTTRGEARWLRDLQEEHGWESVGVITVAPHISRTRVIMGRCWDGDIAYFESGEPLWFELWVEQYLYQTAAFVKVAFERGC